MRKRRQLSRADVPGLLRKARKDLRAADDLIRLGYHDQAVSRLYYAMFYSAEAALLAGPDKTFSRHAGVIGAFGLYFTRPGVLPQELHEWLRAAYDARNMADYAPGRAIRKDDALDLLQKGRAFVRAVENYIRRTTGGLAGA